WSCGSIPTRRGTSRRRIARSCSASRCRRYGCGPTRRCWRCGPSGRWLSTAHPERTPFPFVAAKARSLAMSSETPDHRQRILLVTGMLGAGKTTALRALEDLGWEAVDNFPIRLFKRLVGGDDPNPSLAIGFDCRTRDFDPADVIERVKRLEDREDVVVTTLFLDCAGHELERRFNETRRRHFLAQDRPVETGIAAEREDR